jgi:hypothetical protein
MGTPSSACGATLALGPSWLGRWGGNPAEERMGHACWVTHTSSLAAQAAGGTGQVVTPLPVEGLAGRPP